MRNRLFTLFVLGLSLTFWSCETIVEIDLPENEPKLVLNALFTEGDTLLATVSLSKGILENDDFTFLDDATLSVRKPDGQSISLISNGEGQYLSDGVLNGIGAYSITASHPNYETVNAVTNLPKPTEVLNVSMRPTRFEGFNYEQVSITFTDEATEENFYAIRIIGNSPIYNSTFDAVTGEFIVDTIYFRDEIFYSSNDPVLEENDFGSVRVFNDLLFNGETYTVDVLIDAFYFEFTEVPGLTPELEVQFLSLSKDYYEYQRTYNRFLLTNGDPFAQPSQVYGNVNEGFGIFGGYAAFVYTIQL